MSSISNTQAGQGLVQFLQSLTGNSKTKSTSSPTSALTSALAAGGSSGTGKTRGHHHHGDVGGFQKLLDTVTTALQSAQSSGTTADPNQTIESALEKVFKNGIAGNTAGSSTPPQSTDKTDAASTTDADAAKQSFLDALKSFGVTPQQFQQDLVTAFKQAGGGQINAAIAFQSLPPGTLVDAVG